LRDLLPADLDVGADFTGLLDRLDPVSVHLCPVCPGEPLDRDFSLFSLD